MVKSSHILLRCSAHCANEVPCFQTHSMDAGLRIVCLQVMLDWRLLLAMRLKTSPWLRMLAMPGTMYL